MVGLCPALVGIQAVLRPTCRCSGGEHACLLPHMSSWCLKARTGLMCPRPSLSPAVHSSIHSVNTFWDPSGCGTWARRCESGQRRTVYPVLRAEGAGSGRGTPPPARSEKAPGEGVSDLDLEECFRITQGERGKRQR